MPTKAKVDEAIAENVSFATRYRSPDYIYRRLRFDQTYRKHLARQSLFWFAHIYFAKYITYPTADFQRHIYNALSDERVRFTEILAFRGSTKTTIATLILPIWMISTGRARYTILIGDTFSQAKQYIFNLKSEMETNELLVMDFGPFKPETKEESEEWQKTTVVIPKYRARVSAHSSGQNIRGLRHLEKRPDLVVADDLENLDAVRHKEQRDKLYEWYKGEVLNVGDKDTRYILIGNLLHTDSLMNRIKREIVSDKLAGDIIEYPLVTRTGKITWPGKYPDQRTLDAERRKIGSDRTWRREMLLQIIPDEGQVVKDEWIKTVPAIPAGFQPTRTGCGVDLAISKETTADYTAFVRATAGRLDGKPKIYVTECLNARLSMFEMVDRARLMAEQSQGIQFYVEQVAYQQAAIETMKRAMLSVKGMKPIGDKRARFETVALHVQDGTIEFVDGACDDLLIQMLHFGVEAHDDLLDAWVYCMIGLLQTSMSDPQVLWF